MDRWEVRCQRGRVSFRRKRTLNMGTYLIFEMEMAHTKSLSHP